jgi:cysteine sulfinate desulfinase/cysteine desulfurase-like protein
MGSEGMTFANFLSLVDQYAQHHASHRYGQSVMNVLYSLRPDLHECARVNRCDIFYTTDTTEIATMLQWLEQEWNRHVA